MIENETELLWGDMTKRSVADKNNSPRSAAFWSDQIDNS